MRRLVRIVIANWRIHLLAALLALALASCVAAGYSCGYSAGYSAGRDSHQNVNELIDAGFLVTDPEGFPVRQFDED